MTLTLRRWGLYTHELVGLSFISFLKSYSECNVINMLATETFGEVDGY